MLEGVIVKLREDEAPICVTYTLYVSLVTTSSTTTIPLLVSPSFADAITETIPIPSPLLIFNEIQSRFSVTLQVLGIFMDKN